MHLVHKVRNLGMKIWILKKRKNIWTERWQVSQPRAKDLTKKIKTLAKRIMVGTTIEITIMISLDIEIGAGIEMVIRGQSMAKRIRVACMFHPGTVMLVRAIRKRKTCLQKL